MYASFLKLAAKYLVVGGNAGQNKQTKHKYALFLKIAEKSLVGNENKWTKLTCGYGHLVLKAFVTNCLIVSFQKPAFKLQ